MNMSQFVSNLYLQEQAVVEVTTLIVDRVEVRVIFFDIFLHDEHITHVFIGYGGSGGGGGGQHYSGGGQSYGGGQSGYDNQQQGGGGGRW